MAPRSMHVGYQLGIAAFLARGIGILRQSTITQSNPQVIKISVNIEKIPGRGEDAEPILSISQNNGGFIGVFDGLGGAGGVAYDHNGTVYSGAYHASRIARQVVLERFANFQDQIEAGDEVFAQQLADTLREVLLDELKKKIAQLDKNPTKLKSALIRRLPTTLTLMCFMPTKDFLHCLTIWAGDSRGYLLVPTRGLQQITRDDLKSEGDALDNLTEDSPLSNFVNADVDFELHSQFHKVSKPTILFVATDGCFGYLPTPMHFEYFLLRTLSEAKDELDWQQRLTDGFAQFAGDDVSMALVAVGWSSFNELKKCFSVRRKALSEQYLKPLDHIDIAIAEHKSELEKLADSQVDLRKQVWNRYRNDYESYLIPRL